MTRHYAALTAVFATLLLAAHASAQLRVVTTTTVLADLARTIGRDRVRVETICQGGQDPHYVQAKPSYMVTLSRADLLLSVGLDLEIGWLPALLQGARNPDVNPGHPGYLEASAFIRPIEVPKGSVDRSSGDVHLLGNPHYWLDPDNAKLIARGIASRLSQLDPGGAESFRKNLREFETRIDRAITRWTQALAPYRGAKIVSYHATFNYFFQRFGLTSIGNLEDRPGIPPSPAHLASLIRTMGQQNVRVIFHEQYYDVSVSKLVASRTGARLLVLPTSVGGVPGTDSYERLIDHLVKTVVEAMRGGSA